jgi:hypothetical protein
MSACKHEIADVIRRFGHSFRETHQPNAWQLRTLDALAKCRTKALGGHKYACDHCGHEHFSYNSCKNRHCPKCQGANNAFWVEDRLETVLAVKHYHLVFTLPESLNKICQLNSRWFYSQMFSSVWETLHQFGYSNYGVEGGAICVLHTWGQNLSLHPHIHCIVPAAGFTLAGNMKHIGTNGKYLYPVRALSTVFRAKFMGTLKQHPERRTISRNHIALEQSAWQKPWVVFCEPSFGKPEHVMGYLGQYIHRIAISNQRILKVTDSHVTFRYKDYHHNKQSKILRLTGEEFLRRFCLHILPRRFVKIRYYGIYSSRFRRQHKTDKLVIIAKEEPVERLKRLTGFDARQCPVCKQGKLMEKAVIPRIRSPSYVYPKTGLINYISAI